MDLEALRKSLLTKFREDTAERLQRMQLAVIELEKSDAARAGDDLARELHTLKGEARILGLAAMGQLAHAAEDLLVATKEGKATATSAADLLLQACDAVGALLEDVDGAKAGTDASSELARRLSAASGRPLAPVKVEGGGRRKADVAPPAAEAPVTPVVVAASEDERRALRPDADPRPNVAAGAAPDAQGATTAPPPRFAAAPDAHAIRVNVDLLDRIGGMAGDLRVESARAKLRFTHVQKVLQRFAELGERLVRAGGTGLETHERELQKLRDDAFKLVRQHADGLDALEGNLGQLTDDVEEARLVPLATVFDALPRAVREMSQEQGKAVDLVFHNPSVGVDRSMLGNVREALVHLLRNAVDHGVEAPDAREAAGKPRSGRIEVEVRADGGVLYLDVRDDGRGIDPERMKSAAVAKKLVTLERAQTMSAREAIDLVFIPGFSTREQVTELSGRGVGMDVVKRKVEAVGGAVSIESTRGLGTRVSLRLPQSLSLIRVLLVRMGQDVYGIPANDVEAVLRVQPKERVEILGAPAVRFRDRPVALVALGALLGLDSAANADRPPAVIVRHGADQAALAVDAFVDEREVAVKPCGGEILAGAPFIAGTAALEDGRIAVLLHVPDVMAEVRKATRPGTAARAVKRLRILLVDDSPIARATEAALVKALGHAVDEAQDGEEGLTRVQGGTYDLVLTDVQMPKMDGFALTRRIKGAPELSKLPVIILSSLASPEDKRRGAEAGADAYLVKAELAVETLAQAIERLT